MKRRAPPCTSVVSDADRASTSKDFINDDELLKALHYSVVKSADEISKTNGLNGMTFDQDLLSNVASLVWDTVVTDWTTDLLTFSSHAKRSTVDKDDVLLLMRRNESLTRTICSDADIELDATAKKNKTPAVRKRKSDALNDNTPKTTRRARKASDINTINERGVGNYGEEPPEPPSGFRSAEFATGPLMDDQIGAHSHPVFGQKNEEEVSNVSISMRKTAAYSLADSSNIRLNNDDSSMSSAIEKKKVVEADEEPLSKDSFYDPVEIMILPPAMTSTPIGKSANFSRKDTEVIISSEVAECSNIEGEYTIAGGNVKPTTTGGAFSAFNFETQSSDDNLEDAATPAQDMRVEDRTSTKKQDEAYDSFDEELDTLFSSIPRADTSEVRKSVDQPSDEKDSFDDIFNCD